MSAHGRRIARTPLLAVPSAVAALMLLTPWSAQAAVVWDGAASQGTAVFGSTECAAPGSLVTAAQDDGHGTVFRYTKAVGVYRCESRGIKVDGSRYPFAADRTYWLGWEQKFSVVAVAPTGSRGSGSRIRTPPRTTPC